MQTFLFYDIETTGLNKAFDQVLQFAAIRTDLQLKEIERYEINVKLNPDIIPSPHAVITHRIGVQAAQQGLSEFEAIKQIHALINEPGTISLGYNTLNFDDEFLRFSFYRNLLPPYTHQYANQCSRMDIFPMATMFFLFKNHVLQWPLNAEGQISLKLEALNEANSLAKGRAHHAMVDVEATLALAQRLFAECEMWNYVTGYFNKQIDQTRSQQSDALMVYSKFGSTQFFQSPVLFLGNHRHYRNQQIWLRLDVKKFEEAAPADFEDFKLVVNKKLGEPGFMLPMQDRFLIHLNAERQSLSSENKKWLSQHSDQFQQLVNYHTECKYPTHPQTDVEASLYLNGFWTDEENYFCKQFHRATPEEKVLLTDRVKNPSLKALATRILARHFPELLSLNQAELYAAFRDTAQQEGVVDFKGEKRLTVGLAMENIKQLRAKNNLSEEQITLLKELEEFCCKL